MLGASSKGSRRRFQAESATPSAPFCSSAVSSPRGQGFECHAAPPLFKDQKSITRSRSDASFFSLGATPSPVHGMVAIAGRRRQMVNAMSAVPGFLTIRCNDVHHFFGVYDGFGGSEAAEFCKSQLHRAINEEVKLRTKSLESTSGLSSSVWTNVMSSSFSKVRAEINGCYQCLKRASRDRLRGQVLGSTAVVIVLSMHQIVIATCGDARAVLCRNGEAIPLVQLEQLVETVHQTCAAKDLVDIAEPKVECFERCKDDEFLILASHGLWDVIDSTTACNVGRMCLLQSKSTASSESRSDFAAAFLVKLAFSRGSCENISVLVVDLRVNDIC